MLHEIKNVKQERGRGRRRWFESERLEVVIWLDAADRVTGFQLCYDLGEGERALTWREDSGFAHARVDTGDATPLKNETPILEPDDEVPWSELGRRFEAESASLEPELRQLIRERLCAMA